MAAVSKMFPHRHPLYILTFKSLFMQPITTISLSESTYGPSDPFVILARDAKMISPYKMNQIK